MKTDIKLLEVTRRYRKTYKGLTANMYSKMRERYPANKKKNGNFSLAEFRAWLERTPIQKLYKNWVKSGYVKATRPSIDRIDPRKGYIFDNMQVLTYQENRDKGDKEKCLNCGVHIYQFLLDGTLVAAYGSIKEAAIINGVNRNNINSCILGNRNEAGGFRWCEQEAYHKIIGNRFESPEILEVKE